MTSLVSPDPSAPSTLTLTRLAPGATPRNPPPSPPTMPAMCVPWPSASSPRPLARVKSTLARYRPFSAWWFETPLSRIATPTPRPVTAPTPGSVPAHAWSAPMAWSATAIIERTSVSPDRCPTPGSAARRSSCAPSASSTAPVRSHLATRTPCRAATASTSARLPWKMTDRPDRAATASATSRDSFARGDAAASPAIPADNAVTASAAPTHRPSSHFIACLPPSRNSGCPARTRPAGTRSGPAGSGPAS